jgi:hypothetical protein
MHPSTSNRNAGKKERTQQGVNVLYSTILNRKSTASRAEGTVTIRGWLDLSLSPGFRVAELALPSSAASNIDGEVNSLIDCTGEKLGKYG